MSLGRKRTKPTPRAQLRKTLPIEGALARQARQRSRLARALIVALTGLAVAVLVHGFGPPFTFRLGQRPERAIEVRADFSRKDPVRTNQARQEAAGAVDALLVNEPGPIRELQEQLLDLIDAVGQVSTRERLDASLTTSWKLDESTFLDVRAAADNPDRLASLRRQVEAAFAPFVDHGVLGPDALPGEEQPRPTVRVHLQGEPIEAAETVSRDLILPERIKKLDGAAATAFASAFTNPKLGERLYGLVADRLASTPTLKYEEKATKREREVAYESVAEVYRDYNRGEVIVAQGERIGDDQLALLRLEHEASNSRLSWGERIRRGSGVTVLVVAVFALVGYAIRRHHPLLVADYSALASLCGLVVVAMALVRLLAVQPWEAELVPVALAAMILAIAYGAQAAMAVAAGLAVLTCLALGGGLSQFLVLMGGTAVGILPLREVRTRSKPIQVGLFAAVGYFLLTWATGMFQDQAMEVVATEAFWRAGWGLMAGFFLGGCLPFLEKAFGIVTGISLLELGDLSHPLLQELIRRAPGTYNHSVAVGTIAEAAAERIGGNALLVRIGAYFHDIGKMLKPHYFVENQAGATNRHANLAPAMSTLIIIGHVKDGVELGRQHHLPKPIIDLIEQHHGDDARGILLPGGDPPLRRQPRRPGRPGERLPLPRPSTAVEGSRHPDGLRRGGERQQDPDRANAFEDRQPGQHPGAASARRRPVRRMRPDPPRDRRDPREPHQVADRDLPRPRQIPGTEDRLSGRRHAPCFSKNLTMIESDRQNPPPPRRPLATDLEFPPEIRVEVSSTQSHLRVDESALARLAARCLAAEGIERATVTIAVVDDADDPPGQPPTSRPRLADRRRDVRPRRPGRSRALGRTSRLRRDRAPRRPRTGRGIDALRRPRPPAPLRAGRSRSRIRRTDAGARAFPPRPRGDSGPVPGRGAGRPVDRRRTAVSGLSLGWALGLSLPTLTVYLASICLSRALRTYSRSLLEELCESKGRPARADAIAHAHEEMERASEALAVLAGLGLAALLGVAAARAVPGLAGEAVVAIALGVGALGHLVAGLTGRVWAETILDVSWPLAGAMGRVLSPLTALARRVEQFAYNAGGRRNGGPRPASLEVEIHSGPDEAHEPFDEADLPDSTREMIERVVDLVDRDVSEVMIPRSAVVSLPARVSAAEAARAFVASGFSRIPLYGENLDDVVGVLYAKDLFAQMAEVDPSPRVSARVSPRKLARKPLLVPESRGALDLLDDLRRERVQLAVVMDEYGGVAGIVALEDLLERIVGPIHDEHDPIASEESVAILSASQYEVDASVAVEDLNDRLHLNLPTDGDYQTVGGLAFDALGRVPEPGESFRVGAVEFTVLRVVNHAIRRLRLDLRPSTAAVS